MTNETKPLFDEKLAAIYVGKVMLVGLTYVDKSGQPIRQEQFYGKIISASRVKGIELELYGVNAGKTYWLPPDLRGTSFAPPGKYTLRETQEVVTNPDLMGAWVIS